MASAGLAPAHTVSKWPAKPSKMPSLPSRRRCSSGAREPAVAYRCGVTNRSSSNRNSELYSGAAYARS
jgi:hypothetical protein